MARDTHTKSSPITQPVKDGAGVVPEGASPSEVADFLAKARSMAPARPDGARGRLVFALDATMSRQPTWDRACQLQADMFEAAADIGGLDVQLVYFRGFGECRSSKWVGDPRSLADLMVRIDCRGGQTQIGKVLNHARRETGKKRIQALVYVGDCMEENVDELCALAGEIGMLGVPAFMFQEGHEPVAERAFREIARLTGGAYCRFSSASADELRELLSAVAVYAAGGRKALASHSSRSGGARLLIEQMR